MHSNSTVACFLWSHSSLSYKIISKSTRCGSRSQSDDDRNNKQGSPYVPRIEVGRGTKAAFFTEPTSWISSGSEFPGLLPFCEAFRSLLLLIFPNSSLHSLSLIRSMSTVQAVTSWEWTFPEAGVSHQVGGAVWGCSWKGELSIQCCSVSHFIQEFHTAYLRCWVQWLSWAPAGVSVLSGVGRMRFHTRVKVTFTYRRDGRMTKRTRSLSECWLLCCFISVFFSSSFGKRSAGSLRRGCECIVLEPSEMIVVSPIFHS